MDQVPNHKRLKDKAAEVHLNLEKMLHEFRSGG